MLRWLGVALLMVNAVYFSWQWTVAAPPQKSVPAAADSTAAGEPLHLLSEATSASAPAPVAAEAEALARLPVAESVPEEPAFDLCWLVGPYKEPVSARQLRDRLGSLGIEVSLHEIQVQTKSDYWVYLGPEASRASAVALLRELRQKGIDSFLITEGELANGVSLGLFSQQDRARSLLQARSKQGYPAKMVEVPRYRSELWVRLPDQARGQIPGALWDTMTDDMPEVEIRRNRCDVIASGTTIE